MVVNFTNQRLSFRYSLNYDGKIVYKNKTYKVTITNMNVNGAQITFADNDTLFNLLDENNEIVLQFEYENNNITIQSKIIYINIYDVGERNFYTLLGIEFNKKSFEKYKDIVLDILVSIEMKNFFLYKGNNEIRESLIG